MVTVRCNSALALAAEPSKETAALRKWAVTVLEKYAPVNAPLTPDLARALIQNKLNLGSTTARSTFDGFYVPPQVP